MTDHATAKTAASLWAAILGRPEPDDECRRMAATQVLRLRPLPDEVVLAALAVEGHDVERREQFGHKYAVVYPPGFTHVHANECVGVCTVPARYVTGSNVNVSTADTAVEAGHHGPPRAPLWDPAR